MKAVAPDEVWVVTLTLRTQSVRWTTCSRTACCLRTGSHAPLPSGQLCTTSVRRRRASTSNCRERREEEGREEEGREEEGREEEGREEEGREEEGREEEGREEKQLCVCTHMHTHTHLVTE